jgi:ER-bound oxygenase mpaB/B'/Rubber oxygenase, catalytic domain
MTTDMNTVVDHVSTDAADFVTIDLDQFRLTGDSLADVAVAAYFRDVDSSDPGSLFGGLVRHTKLVPEEQNPALRTFFQVAATPPEWVDPLAVERGQQFFNRLVAHHFSALYLASLPNSYAAAKGVQVLRMTGRLQTDTERRLNETAQLLMDVSAPGALADGGSGIDRILHVRLMHAAVRWMITHDPSVTRVDEVAPPATEPDDLLWSRSWGVPINQEDLAGTWLTFTSVVYDAFDASGVDYTDQDIADHLHMWRLVAHHLGVNPLLIPLTRTDARILRTRIFGRQQGPSGAGRVMAAALLAQSRGRMPRMLWPVMPSAFRRFLGDRVCNMIGLPPTNWTRHLFVVMSLVSRVMTLGADHHRLHARLDAFMGRHLMDGILSEMRHGERPGFAIPTHLAANQRGCATRS